MSQPTTQAEAQTQAARDADELGKLGYAQQLFRDMGGFGNFAVSFSIISILTGTTLYGYGLRMGGPLEMTVGWALVTVMTLTVAASLAQLASSFPTAGALYHWSALLGGNGWGFATAWLNIVGQFALTAGIDYGLAEFIAHALSWPLDRLHVLPLYSVLLASHALFNHFGVRAVSVLSWLSAWYHLVGVALLVGALLAFAPLQPASFLFTRFSTEKSPYAYSFLLGLLQAQWTFTGYDASAHITEETVDPRKNAPWGIFLSVAVSGVAGAVLLAVVTLAIRDLPEAASRENPFLFILATALPGSLGGALGLLVMGAMWFCGLASVTSCSRMLFAFARDGGLPRALGAERVSPRFGSPLVAVWLSVGAAFGVAVSARAYAAIVALSTIALYASYGLPIALGLRARAAGRWRVRGPWDLGRLSGAINAIAVAWVAAIGILLVLPPNDLAGYAFAICVILLVVYWFSTMRSRFRGPRSRRMD